MSHGVAQRDTTDCAAEMLATMHAAIEEVARQYAHAWGVACLPCDAQGDLLGGEGRCRTCSHHAGCVTTCKQAIEESVRWGEPAIFLCPQGLMCWVAPLMVNACVLGGLLARRSDGDALSTRDVHRAAHDLLVLTERANLTNGALLQGHREQAERESERAEAIHELKGQQFQSIRDLYLVEEPVLIAAIKRGDRTAAREIINRVLTGIYFLGRNRPLLLKSFLLELVVMMSRSAVEAGGDPAELLGANYSSFAELARIESEEELCAWLVALLERIMDAITANHHYPIGVLLGEALKYMQEHLADDLSRDEVAKVACLSPSHFSRVVKQHCNQSFTDLLAKLRVERARELLTRTEKSLLQICLECGFSDQSYFTKVFQKHTGRSPGEYRRQHRIVR